MSIERGYWIIAAMFPVIALAVWDPFAGVLALVVAGLAASCAMDERAARLTLAEDARVRACWAEEIVIARAREGRRIVGVELCLPCGCHIVGTVNLDADTNTIVAAIADMQAGHS